MKESVAVPADQEEVPRLEGQSGGDSLDANGVDVVSGPGRSPAALAPLAPLGADGAQDLEVPPEGRGRLFGGRGACHGQAKFT